MIVSSIGKSYSDPRQTIVRAGRYKVYFFSVQSMASSSSSTVLSSERTSYFSCQTEMEMESSKARHWSELDYSTTDSELSAAESNFEYFDFLKKDPRWGRFFTDFEALEVGEKISEGAQADIYEARMNRRAPFDLVVKVMKGDAPLKAFQAQWPIGMLSARSKYKLLFDLPLITILGGTMLCDERLRGRFAFVMYRRWGDLRLLIDRRMKQTRSTLGPFPIDEAIHLMLSIAEDMDTLHNKHDILHRDLKASNVLVWGKSEEDMSLVATSGRVARLGSVVADFECSVGVLGTGLWRSPEILEHLKAKVRGREVRFTRASDVYSYGMTCYEIVTGCIPFGGRGGQDTISQILAGVRPELPHDLPEFVRDILVACWHSDPSKRPSFSTICKALKLKLDLKSLSIDIDNKSKRDASIVKVERWNNSKWNNPNSLTLLQVMEKLMDTDLSILRASESSSSDFITQYFEVTDCKGRKAVNDNITKALSFAAKMECISESLGTSLGRIPIVQMHVIEVVAEWSPGLLEALSALLVATNFQVHSAGCWTREGRLECVMFVKGARMGALLWELRHNMKHLKICSGLFKIIVHKSTVEEFSHLSDRLHKLKWMDLLSPHSSSKIRVHQRKECVEGFRSTEVLLCLEERLLLVFIIRTLWRMGYKIVGASVKYPDPYDVHMGKVNESGDIDFGTLNDSDLDNRIHRILGITTERGSSGVYAQISVSGPSEELHNDLMRRLLSKDLVVTGGELYRERWESHTQPPSGSLKFFVSRRPAAGCGYYSFKLPI